METLAQPNIDSLLSRVVMDEEPWPDVGRLFAHSRETAKHPEAAAVSQLTEQMARGNEDAYREFHAQYFHRLLAYLFVVTRGDEDAAREALQLTFMRIVRNIRPFSTAEAFWSWLTVLARSSVVDEQRKRLRYYGLLNRFFERKRIEATEPETDLGKLVQRSLEELPDDERDLLERKYFEGESVRELARSLQASEKAIESRLSRARQKLKESITRQLKYGA